MSNYTLHPDGVAAIEEISEAEARESNPWTWVIDVEGIKQ